MICSRVGSRHSDAAPRACRAGGAQVSATGRCGDAFRCGSAPLRAAGARRGVGGGTHRLPKGVRVLRRLQRLRLPRLQRHRRDTGILRLRRRGDAGGRVSAGARREAAKKPRSAPSRGRRTAAGGGVATRPGGDAPSGDARVVAYTSATAFSAAARSRGDGWLKAARTRSCNAPLLPCLDTRSAPKTARSWSHFRACIIRTRAGCTPPPPGAAMAAAPRKGRAALAAAARAAARQRRATLPGGRERRRR